MYASKNSIATASSMSNPSNPLIAGGNMINPSIKVPTGVSMNTADISTIQDEVSILTYDFWQYLNGLRAEAGKGKLRHDDFLAKVESEIDDLGVCESFTHPQNRQQMKAYRLNKDQMLLVGMRESKAVRKHVLKWLKELESNTAMAIALTMDGKQLRLLAREVTAKEQAIQDTEELRNRVQAKATEPVTITKITRMVKEKAANSGFKMPKLNRRVMNDILIQAGLQTRTDFDHYYLTEEGRVYGNQLTFPTMSYNLWLPDVYKHPKVKAVLTSLLVAK